MNKVPCNVQIPHNPQISVLVELQANVVILALNLEFFVCMGPSAPYSQPRNVAFPIQFDAGSNILRISNIDAFSTDLQSSIFSQSCPGGSLYAQLQVLIVAAESSPKAPGFPC